MKRWIALVLAAALGMGGGILVCLAFQMVQVSDGSMMPELRQGDWTVVRSKGIGDLTVGRGDVVIFENSIYPVTGEDHWAMKRIVGTGGERVRITSGTVYIDDEPLTEPYVFAEGVSGEMEEIHIPDGYFFVLGDNRAASTDSRDETVGLVAEKELIGKVLWH